MFQKNLSQAGFDVVSVLFGLKDTASKAQVFLRLPYLRGSCESLIASWVAHVVGIQSQPDARPTRSVTHIGRPTMNYSHLSL